MFLATDAAAALRSDVQRRARYPWIYPPFCFAAHTGARRSELPRVLLTGVRLAEGAVLIREKKRRRDVGAS